MKSIFKSTVFSILLSLFISNTQLLFAQSKYARTAFRVGTDLFGIGNSIFNNERTQFEINTDLALDKYFIVADFGVDNLTLGSNTITVPTKQTFSYNNTGYYFRIGADVNFMRNDPNNHVIFFGLRYGRSFFSDDLTYEGSNDNFEVSPIESGNENVRGSWFELAAGMKVNLWKELFVGYTVRYKFFRNINNEGFLTPYEMPGYGVYEKESRVGFNYQIFWRFPIKKNATIREQVEGAIKSETK